MIVDTPPGFTPEVIASIDSSSHVCMVGMLDSLSLKNTKLGLETLDLMGYERDRIRLVLNRADSRVGITPRRRRLDRRSHSRTSLVPSDRDVPRSVNEGEPIVRAKPKLGGRQGLPRARRRCTHGAAGAAHAQPAAASAAAAQEEGLDGTPRAPRPRRARRRADRPRPFAELKNRIHLAVIGELGPQLFNVSMDPDALRDRVAPTSGRTSRRSTGISRDDRERLAAEIADDILGHGPLERLLADDSVTEIMVNGPYDVWVERQGRLYETTVRFNDESHLRRIINKIVAQVGRRIDESSPMVDARLPDGSRVNAVIPPLSLSGPARHDPQVQQEAARPRAT